MVIYAAGPYCRDGVHEGIGSDEEEEEDHGLMQLMGYVARIQAMLGSLIAEDGSHSDGV